uniref:Uncharacterized protein n=1 Tax=Micrurus surinamensis TaxID=129470 RepID=A0A2D4P909_MICSU
MRHMCACNYLMHDQDSTNIKELVSIMYKSFKNLFVNLNVIVVVSGTSLFQLNHKAFRMNYLIVDEGYRNCGIGGPNSYRLQQCCQRNWLCSQRRWWAEEDFF